MSFFPTPPTYTAYDVTKEALRIAHMRKTRKGWEIVRLETVAAGSDVNPLDSATLTVAALPAEKMLVRMCEMQVKRERDLKAILDFQIEPLLPYPAERAIIQAEPIEKRINGILLTAYAVRVDHVEEFVDQLRERALEPERITSVPSALAALSTLFPQTATAQFLVYEGESAVTCVLIEKGHLLASRAFDRSLDIGKEVQKTILSFAAIHKTKTFETILLIGSDNEAIQAATGKTVLLPTSTQLTLSQEDLVHYGLSIGIALAAEGVDFRQKAFLYPHKWRRVKKPLLATLALTTLLFGCIAGFGHSALQKKKAAVAEAYLSLLEVVADVPTLYHRIKVTATADAKTALDDTIAARQSIEADLQAANPKPMLWKKFKTPGFGVGRNLRFGDLDGDGQIDVLIGQVRHHGPKDSNSEISCLTAMTFDGKQLWQVGEADAWHDHLTSDVAFQIHDLDGDGRKEVIYTSGLQLIVLDGASGKKLRQSPTPNTPEKNKPPQNKFSRILGDSIYFCDLQGIGRDSDLIIKDRYSCVWALDDQGNVKWQAKCNTGHYPYAADIDGDGKDELMVGYTLFDDDGSRLWSLDGQVKDHADGVALVRFRQDAPYRLFFAASDEGMFFADMQGNVLKHHYLGHVQNPAIADFRPDLPGLEAVSINFWGNQGIVHFYDSNGEIIHDFEPCQHGSMALPINWTGKPGEFFVLSPDVRDGGLFDGWGRRVVTFPADGHPDQCNAVLDLTGDCRDEIVVWDPYEIWVYTQEDNPLKGDLYRTIRNPLYNYSNYQTTVSLPATEP